MRRHSVIETTASELETKNSHSLGGACNLHERHVRRQTPPSPNPREPNEKNLFVFDEDRARFL